MATRPCPKDQNNDAYLEELLQTVVEAGTDEHCILAILNLQRRVIQGDQERLFELVHPSSEERKRLHELLSDVSLEELESKGTEENVWPALVVARFALQGLPCPDSCQLAALFSKTALVSFNTKLCHYPTELVRHVPCVLLAQACSTNCFMWFVAILSLGILIRGEIAEFPMNTPEEILNSLKQMGPHVQGTTIGNSFFRSLSRNPTFNQGADEQFKGVVRKLRLADVITDSSLNKILATEPSFGAFLDALVMNVGGEGVAQLMTWRAVHYKPRAATAAITAGILRQRIVPMPFLQRKCVSYILGCEVDEVVPAVKEYARQKRQRK
mmetsp:Transcript_3832/g.4754  ORF Transcript_3832/g.4754 Transcript_3832/m.4754 type:complete len:326 (-) Transcript_3832:251-1228(-)